ncbi:MAG TPA: biopolymer transporter ExbD [Bacteroidetes bacterium]|nr:biopolymer transporter ExbD [Bacteroidota bacterium]
MNIKRSTGRASGEGDDVNITPVMNLFLVLIPFLLLTAEFVRIAVLELNLPSTAQSSVSNKKENDKKLIIILLGIDDKGFTLKVPRLRIAPIPKKGEQFQYEKLAAALKQIKGRYPDTEEITIQPVDEISYQTIVNVMDACRDNGFPNISISG